MFNVRCGNNSLNDSFVAGYQQTFTNGLQVSVQMGTFNYCDNKDKKHKINGGSLMKSKTAEVAVFDTFKENQPFVKGWPHCPVYDTVAANLTSEQVLEVLN
jgi:hypothetical protein